MFRWLRLQGEALVWRGGREGALQRKELSVIEGLVCSRAAPVPPSWSLGQDRLYVTLETIRYRAFGASFIVEDLIYLGF